MNKPLIAVLLAAVAGIASAQNAPAPAASGVVAPKVAADRAVTQGAKADLRTDKANRRNENQQLQADRAAGNTAAVQTDLAAKKADSSEVRTDRGQVAQDRATTKAQRAANKRPVPSAGRP